MTAPRTDHGFVSRVVEAFLHGNLSVLLILVMLACGVAALALTPREEEPQIVVPLADIYVRMPGATAEEVEQQVSSKLERLLAQIDGVEYVYSMSRPGEATVTVRFFVGENREDSIVKLHNKIMMNTDVVPPGVTGWVVKPIEIDDVPLVNVTLWSKTADDFALRRVAEQVEVALQSVPETARTEVVGGRRRQLRVTLDPERMTARQVTPLDVDRVLRGANINIQAGNLRANNSEVLVEGGPFVQSAKELETLVVGVFDGKPVYVREIAKVVDGPEEPGNYSRISFGPGAKNRPEGAADYPAVTVGVAKRKGSNAVSVAHAIEEKLNELRGTVIPHDIEARVTRNYGETANEKVNELIRELGLAIVIVSALIMFSLGWREAIIVVTAVPLTFALTLLLNYLAGYSINRVTLFALILALGLVVDDPIVDVENIFRHFRLRKQPPREAVLTAVNEVRPPIIVATLVVMVSFLPMLFITGMMGPYMRPMALNVPVAMFMSMVVAFTVTPWLSYQVLKGVYGKGGHEPTDPHNTLTYRVYKAVLTPFLNSRRAAWGLIGFTALLLAAACALPALGLVPLKMLPFDNKNEFQVLVDLPEGTTIESTDAVLKEMADELRKHPEVAEVMSFAGTASPMDFNGMVRHYYLRREAHRGDLRVNLIAKEDRAEQSHALVLRVREGLERIAKKHNARIKIVEVPPGPPVLSTLVAEVYSKPAQSYAELKADTRHVRALFAKEPGVVDIDDTFEVERPRYVFRVDKEKASLTGITTEQIANTLRIGVNGMTPGEGDPKDFRAGSGHLPRELNPLAILIQLPQESRTGLNDLLRLGVKTPTGYIVRVGELGAFDKLPAEQTIYHKNQRRVAYVTAETAGRTPGEAVIGLLFKLRDNPTPGGAEVVWTGEGEWKITLDVFRDLGLAFGGALLLIYILMVYQTGSYLIPLVQMISIPLTVIGIMPGFWLLNLVTGSTVGGYVNPVYFTATAMIGMIALAGIADRNAILLLDFIQHVRARGASLKEALIESGAVRFRPILLTAGAAMLGAWPITLDPVFSGLAWALIFGLVVSTAFTLLLVPVVYWMLYRESEPASRQHETAASIPAASLLSADRHPESSIPPTPSQK
ncbi:MAG: efflux RND transporter permease subunit [Planctomycetia bacterium]|nr:efflux RND transporter permease subunit [Planctomycetia bacterium]